MARKNMTVPIEVGEYETGCHTHMGNDLALYVQTTRNLHERREKVFAEIMRQKQAWKGASEFNVLLRMDKPGRELFRTAVESYHREILEYQSSPDMSETVQLAGGGVAGVAEDFVGWLFREFANWSID